MINIFSFEVSLFQFKDFLKLDRTFGLVLDFVFSHYKTFNYLFFKKNSKVGLVSN